MSFCKLKFSRLVENDPYLGAVVAPVQLGVDNNAEVFEGVVEEIIVTTKCLVAIFTENNVTGTCPSHVTCEAR